MSEYILPVLGYFQKEYGIEKPGDVLWSHAVNSVDKLQRNLGRKSAMIIESDIGMSRAGEIVTAHPPETESDLERA